jgi:DegV family protein with EDD domain
MTRVCIITDSTVQFTSATFPGRDLVTVVPMQIGINGKLYSDNREIKINQLPLSARDGLEPQVRPPDPFQFGQIMTEVGQNCDEIVAILLSSHLNPAIYSAQEAAASGYCPVTVHVVDSQTTGAGLGLLVQAAAEAASLEAPAVEIKQLLHGLIPHVYTIFCMQSLTYLAHSVQIDLAQALVGEMLGVIPILVLENGRLMPMKKARTSRHLVDIFHEFLSEFGQLRHVALTQGMPPFTHEARALRERISADYPNTPYTEHTFGAALATILGPRSMGLVAMEK